MAAEQSWESLMQPLLDQRSMVDSILQSLDEEQRIAVHDESRVVRVVAGPGSGKTRVLSARVAFLLMKNVDPANIMVLTFTNKAAKELKERVNAFSQQTVNQKHMWIGTFHGLANRILRQQIELLGLGITKNFTIYDEGDAKTVLRKILIQSADLAPVPKNGTREEKKLVRSTNKAQMTKLRSKADEYSRWISHIKDIVPCYVGMSATDLFHTYWKSKEQLIGQETSSQSRAPSLDFFENIFVEYNNALKEQNALDFGDLISMCNALFKLKPVRNQSRDKFKHILVDEFQDTNAVQYEFLTLLTKDKGGTDGNSRAPNLFVVGDPDQSIYKFRGSDMLNMLRKMEEDYGSALSTQTLLRNYRNKSRILQGAQNMLNSHGSSHLRQDYIPTRKGQGFLSVSRFKNDQNEARSVANSIEELNRKGVSYQDIGVLFRTQTIARSIEQELALSRIPFSARQSFWSRAEIKDMLCYLLLLDNPDDLRAFEHILNTPKRGIGPHSVKAISDWAKEDSQGSRYPGFLFHDLINNFMGKEDCAKVFSLLQQGADISKAVDAISNFEIPTLPSKQSMGVSKPAWKGLCDLRNLFVFLRSTARYHSVYHVIESVLLGAGYEEYINGTVNPETKLQNIRSMAPQHDCATGLDALQEYVQNGLLWSPEDEQVGDKVHLSTMHAAKGLEFKVVFVLGLEHGRTPLIYNNECSLEEETRLMYVAMTRAEEILFLTHVEKRGPFRGLSPSQYLTDLGAPSHSSVPLSKI